MSVPLIVTISGPSMCRGSWRLCLQARLGALRAQRGGVSPGGGLEHVSGQQDFM